MISLGTYGKIIREYEGEGLLTFDDGQGCACSVHAVQLADGKIMASCFFTKDLRLLYQCFNQSRSIQSISGVTSKGKEFLLEGRLLYTHFSDRVTRQEHTISMVTIASSITVKRRIEGVPRLLKFGITNFEFIGNSWREDADGDGGLRVLATNLPDGKIAIHELDDYKDTIESIKAQKGIDVTCEARVNISSLGDLEKATEFVDVICRILSFARGTKINWIYYDCYDEFGENLLSFHKNNVTWQYVGLPLIDPRNPNDTAFFVEQVYNPFLQQKDVYGLDIAIESYLDAKRETGYLETRALRAVVVMEFLKTRYAMRRKAEFILKAKDFKKIRQQVKRIIDQQFEELSLSPKNSLQEMKSKIAELNRKPFKSILKKMFEQIGLAVTEDNLDRFIKIRNSLVHKASFTTNTTQGRWQEYTFIIGMLDRLFLKMLSYNGDILDITNRFERVRI